jgi:hypothetical protein
MKQLVFVRHYNVHPLARTTDHTGLDLSRVLAEAAEALPRNTDELVRLAYDSVPDSCSECIMGV